MKARVHVTLKPGVLDPKGKAIHHALTQIGFEGVAGVRTGKLIELELDDGDGGDREAAHARVARMCEELLANTVIETYSIEIAD